MMRSAESGFLRNPTLAAMVGSAVFHGILVMVAILNPADSKTSNPLRIISLTPPVQNPGFSKPGSTLQVPNVQPPVNLGNAPGSPPLPGVSNFKTVPSPSIYLGGANLPSISMRNLQTRDIPQPSFQNPGIPTFGPGYPSPGNPGGGFPPGMIPPNFVPNTSRLNQPNPPVPHQPQKGQFESAPKSTASVPNYRDYAVAKNPDIPTVASENFQTSDSTNSLYARTSPPARSPNSLETTPNNLPPQKIAKVMTPLEREGLKKFNDTMSDRLGQKLSIQIGPSLTAAYPLAACPSGQSDSAIIAAVFGPDGALASGANSVTVARSASSTALNQAAIAVVEGYRAPAAQGYQLFNFTVDIPYSETVCKATNPKPSSTPSESPVLAPSVGPSAKPSVILPSPNPTSSSQPPQPSRPKPTPPSEIPTSGPSVPPPTESPGPLSPLPEPSPLTPLEPAPTPSSGPSESPSSPTPGAIEQPSNPTDESPQMEPLPTPSVTVPDESKP